MTNRECVFFKEKRVWVTLLSTSVLWNMLGQWISFLKKNTANRNAATRRNKM